MTVPCGVKACAVSICERVTNYGSNVNVIDTCIAVLATLLLWCSCHNRVVHLLI